MENLNSEQLEARIVARGEHSGHSHVIVGNATIERVGEDVFINPEDSTAVIRHLMEDKWMQGVQVFTKEHEDINLFTGEDILRHGDVILKREKTGKHKGSYKYIKSIEFDPLENITREVKD